MSMMITHGVRDQDEADQLARELGAESYGTMRYPPPHDASIFALYYFNSAGREVGYYIPDLQTFTPCETPRTWGPEAFWVLSRRTKLITPKADSGEGEK